jgi:3-hydroxyacyl-CoA dehydrogenase
MMNARGRIVVTANASDLAGCDLVVKAIIETQRPERVIGMH